MTTTASAIPYAKLKPGMRLRLTTADFSALVIGTLLSKHNGTKTLVCLLDGNTNPTTFDCAAVVEVLPADPLDQIHPMLANNVEDCADLSLASLVASDEWRFEKKYDGEREIIALLPLTRSQACPVDYAWRDDAEVAFRATSRVIGKNSGRLGVNTFHLPHLNQILAHLMPMDGVTVFDGELDSTRFNNDEANFKYVASIMRSLAPRAVEMQAQHGRLVYRIYDILWFNGRDLRGYPKDVRRTILQSWWTEAYEYLMTVGDEDVLNAFLDHVFIAPEATGTAEKEAMLDQMVTEGWEGVMAKRQSAPYTDTTTPGRRSADLLKVKPVRDKEVVILGFVMGDGEYNRAKYGAIRFAEWVPRDKVTEGMVKYEVQRDAEHENIKLLIDSVFGTPWYVNHTLIEVGTAGGFTQEQEQEFRETPWQYIAQPMTVKYKLRWTDTGRMRHAFFKAMRPDVTRLDGCLYDG